MSLPFQRSTHFDLGIDALATQSDLASMADTWVVGGSPVPQTRMSEVIPALPDLSPWAAALELPGLDCSSLHH